MENQKDLQCPNCGGKEELYWIHLGHEWDEVECLDCGETFDEEDGQLWND